MSHPLLRWMRHETLNPHMAKRKHIRYYAEWGTRHWTHICPSANTSAITLNEAQDIEPMYSQAQTHLLLCWMRHETLNPRIAKRKHIRYYTEWGTRHWTHICPSANTSAITLNEEIDIEPTYSQAQSHPLLGWMRHQTLNPRLPKAHIGFYTQCGIRL